MQSLPLYINSFKLKAKSFKLPALRLLRKLLFISSLLITAGCGLGDYTKHLGGGYSLERTNGCCIFIFKDEVKPKNYKNITVYDGRVIKPFVRDLYLDKEKIVGYKVDNKCCYLSEEEKAFNTQNGYFIIYKNSDKIVTGLSTQELLELNIFLNKMKEVLKDRLLEWGLEYYWSKYY